MEKKFLPDKSLLENNITVYLNERCQRSQEVKSMLESACIPFETIEGVGFPEVNYGRRRYIGVDEIKLFIHYYKRVLSNLQK